MRLGFDGRASEEAANYHTAPQALPRSLEHASFRTKKRLIAMLRSRDPVPEAMQNLHLLLQDSDVDAKVTAECLQKLSEWLRRNAPSTQQLCVKFRIHGAINAVLARHAADIDVARAGLSVVAGVAVASSENASALTRSGVLLQLYRMMEAHPRDRIALDNAAVALWKLGERGAARQITLTGGAGKLMGAMRANPANPFLQSNGCSALQVLLESGGCTEVEEMRELALVAGANHKGNIPIRRSTDKLVRWCELMLKKGVRKADAVKIVRPKALVKGNEAGHLPQLRAPQISLKDWLAEVDREGQLAAYYRDLCQNFDSVAHLIDAYARDGVLTVDFFEDMGISNAEHRACINNWFQDLLNRQDEIREDEHSPYQLPDQLNAALPAWGQGSERELPGPEGRGTLSTENFRRLESDDEDEEGAQWPKGWARALDLLEKVGLRETLWERACEHLETFRRRGTGGFTRLRVDLDEDSSGSDGGSSGDGEQVDELARASFNAALKTCEEGWKWEQALFLLGEMRQVVPPDEHSYTAVIGACAAERQWAHALSLLRQMRGQGAYVKTVTYNAAIWSLEEEGAPWQRAVSLLEEMRDLGVGREPTALTYTAAVNVFAVHGRWEETVAVIDEMRQRGVRPDVGTYRAIAEVDWGCDWPADAALDALDRIKRAVRF